MKSFANQQPASIQLGNSNFGKTKEAHSKSIKNKNIHSVHSTIVLPIEPKKEEQENQVRRALMSSSHSLDSNIGKNLETKFGHSFSNIRIHDNPIANDSAKQLGANAYTVGKDIVFRQKMHGFQTHNKQKLLAHELVHVLQSNSNTSKNTASNSVQLIPPNQMAEREADLISKNLSASFSPTPQEKIAPNVLMPSLQSIERDFHDPNFCYRPENSNPPDRSKVIAKMQAEIETPDNCTDEIILRTSVLDSYWGSQSAEFETYGGGTSHLIQQDLHRNGNAERVDFEERFNLNDCHAFFSRCHLITFYENGTKYTFADAGYEPNIFATCEAATEGVDSCEIGGTALHDMTPAPQLIVNPCNHLSPSLCQ